MNGDYGRYVDGEWDRAEAEMLEQVNLATGNPTVRLPGLFNQESEAAQPETPPSFGSSTDVSPGGSSDGDQT